jgi:16S rRNA (cytosine967-C5)-methyltransferase
MLRVEENRAWSNLALDNLINRAGLSERDGALAPALFYGALERKITLDVCVAAHSKTRLEKISPVVRNILRVTLYQLLYMDKIPDSAAVDEGVELAKRMGLAKASGFVNGVARSFLRAGKAIPLPETEPDRASVKYSMPMPILRLWADSYGWERAEEFAANSLGHAPTFIRVNTLKTTGPELISRLAARGLEAKPHPTIPHCLELDRPGSLLKLPEFAQGLFNTQDASSQACVLALDPKPGSRVLDVCSAPGGKAFAMAMLMEGKGELVATELHERRTGLVKKGAQRLGIRNLRAVALDMSEYHPELGGFDYVLCDAPCSGLGVIRRKPEIKYKPLEEFDNLPEIQYKILEAASQYCREGGRLVYSTCTLNPAENSRVAERLLRERAEIVPDTLPGFLGGGWERTLAGEMGGDGFYIACFRRVSG